MAAPRFEIIEDEGTPEVRPQPRQSPQNDPAFSALMLALKTMSQRTVIALSRLSSLAMAGSVFWLFMSIPNPTPYQIIWGGMYSAFVLTAVFFMGRLR